VAIYKTGTEGKVEMIEIVKDDTIQRCDSCAGWFRLMAVITKYDEHYPDSHRDRPQICADCLAAGNRKMLAAEIVARLKEGS